MSVSSGKVHLVGAGPGDPGLITVRGAALLAAADAVVYDYLVHPSLLDTCRPDCQKIHVGKQSGFHSVPQEEIERILVRLCKEGKTVVRLKGGDPFLYGRGGEEALSLARNGIPFEVVPGITAAIAAGAYAGIPLTHRNTSSAVVFLTGHEDPAKKELDVDWASFAKLDATLCIYMGMGHLEEIVSRLMDGGMRPEMPAAVIQWASLPRQRGLLTRLDSLAADCRREGLSSPAVVIIGPVAERMREIGWYESLPLFGRRLVVTRNRERAEDLVNLLSSLGAEVLSIPLVEITPAAHPEIADEVFEEFWSYEWIVFTSANGARFFFDRFFDRFEDIRALGGVRFAAIGKTTSREIEKFRLRVELVAGVSTAEGLAEDLAATGSLDNAKVLVVTGNRNRDLLADRLREAGAIVDQFPVYRTENARLEDSPEVADFCRGGADLLIFTSSSAVDAFVRQSARLQISKEGRRPLAASLGPLTTERLRAKGIPLAVEAPAANVESLVQAVCDWCSRRSP